MNYDSIFAAASKQDNFVVGLTRNPPDTMPPTSYGYTTCGQFNGIAEPAASLTVNCDISLPSARYVVIVSQSDSLYICELVVYGAGKVRQRLE